MHHRGDLMKKVISLFLICCMLVLLLSGCNNSTGKSNSDYDFLTDMQYGYCYMSNGRMNCTESEKGYYYLGDHNILLFVDKQSMEGTPLCNKVNCLHNDPDECEAYGYGITQYNNGYLYTMISEYDNEKMTDIQYIMRVSEDGTVKEKITNGFDEYTLDWFIHRGYIYYVTHTGLYKLSISTPKGDKELLINFSEYGYKQVDIDKFLAYNNYVYVSVSALAENETDKFFTNTYAYNTDSNASVELDYENEMQSIATFVDGKMITYKAVSDGEKYNTVYYISDLNGDNQEKYLEYPAGFYVYSDGKYIYVDDGAYQEFSNKSLEGDFTQTIKVYDLKMKELDSFVLPFDTWIDLCAQSTDHFLIRGITGEENEQLYCIEKSGISNYNGASAIKTHICDLNWKKPINSNTEI